MIKYRLEPFYMHNCWMENNDINTLECSNTYYNWDKDFDTLEEAKEYAAEDMKLEFPSKLKDGLKNLTESEIIEKYDGYVKWKIYKIENDFYELVLEAIPMNRCLRGKEIKWKEV